MKPIQDVLCNPGDRAAYGTYKFARNILWIPSAIFEAARSLVRRELPVGFFERRGLYQTRRPTKNPLMWFHANSAGECVLCLPLIHRVVVEYNEKVLILVTVRSDDALELLQSSLPDRVLLIRAPEDTSFAVRRFLEHWKPCIGVMLSAWLAPNLVVMSSQAGIPLALLDGSIPLHIFHFWHRARPMRTLWRAMSSCFQLIIPHSDIDVGRFRLMGASLSQMPGWCNDLSYACSLSAPVANFWRPPVSQINALEQLLSKRMTWMVCHTRPSEEPQLRNAHSELRTEFPSLLTIIVYQGPDLGASLASDWASSRISCASTSEMPASRALLCSEHFRHEVTVSILCKSAPLAPVTKNLYLTSSFHAVDDVEVLIVDTPWLVPILMHICEIVYIGSMKLTGELNYMVMAQAAVSGCAVVASQSVVAHEPLAHEQLAQELNNAAVSVAEDAAHAVRTAGVALVSKLCNVE